MFISKLSNALNRYDQYGIIRVNTLHTLYLTICIFLINFIFSPPFITQLMPIFLMGIIAAGSSPSYIRRQQIVAVFTALAIIWFVCVNLVANHNLATLLVNIFLLSVLYWIGRKIPIFGAIALVCYILGIILPPLNVSGSFYVYYNLVVMCGIYLIAIIACMNLFPRIYYHRIWVRAFYLCLTELAKIQRSIAEGEIKFSNSKHLIGLYRITSGLTRTEFKFGARRVNISLLRLYTYMTTLRTGLFSVNQQTLLEGAQLCDNLSQKICNGEKLNISAFTINGLPNEIKYALQQLILVWNRTCLKV